MYNDVLDDILSDIENNKGEIVGGIPSGTRVEFTPEENISKDVVESEKMPEELLINHDEEETKLTIEYARRVIALEREIKEIKDDLKVIKEEYKDNGVSVQKVNKAIKNIKMAMKLNTLDEAEIEMIQTVISSNPDIHTEIALLVEK